MWFRIREKPSIWITLQASKMTRLWDVSGHGIACIGRRRWLTCLSLLSIVKAYYLVGIIAISGDGRMTNQGPWLILYLFWQLGQALIEKKQHTEGKSGNNVRCKWVLTHLFVALNKLKTGMKVVKGMLIHIEADRSLFTAYELAIQQRVKYVNDILQALLTARKRVFIYLYGILIRRTNGGNVFLEMGWSRSRSTCTWIITVTICQEPCGSWTQATTRGSRRWWRKGWWNQLFDSKHSTTNIIM